MNEKTSGTKSPIRKLRRLLPIAAVLLVLAVLCVAPVGADDTAVTPVEIKATYEWYTSVSEGDTYTINTIDNLTGLANIVNGIDGQTKFDFEGKTVILGADLAFADNQYWYYNDGTNTYDYIIKEFAGTFDGQNHKITGLKFYTAVKPSTWGLFGTIKDTGKVSSLTLDTVTAEYTAATDSLYRCPFGFIAVTLYGEATNCHVKNVVVTTNTYAALREGGAMFSNVHGKATGCTGTNVVIDSQYDGVNGNQYNLEDLGGLIGTVLNGGIADGCSINGVQILMENGGYSKKVGGFAGKVYGGGTVKNCQANDVTIIANGALYNAGGFIGVTEKAGSENDITINGCTITDVTLTAGSTAKIAGGFVGEAGGSVILTGCKASDVTMDIGESQSHGAFGGFAGQTNSASKPVVFDNCHVEELEMTVQGKPESSVGGFITAIGASAEIKGCTASGSINAVGADETKPIGGFLGDTGWNNNVQCTIEQSSADVDIDANAPAGGFVASAQPNSNADRNSQLTITDSTASGDVSSVSGAAGGFVGTGNRGTYDGCTAEGTVSGDVAGGFWGEITPNKATDENMDKSLTITGSSATGVVLGTTVASGFVGTVTTATTPTTEGESDNATPVKIESSFAAPVVAGATSNTEINNFAKDETPEGSESKYDDKAESNVPPKTTVQPTTENEELTLKDGNVVIPDGVSADVTTGGATTTIKPTTNGGDAPSINNAGQITTPKDVSLDVTTEDGATVTVKPTTDADLTLDNGNIVIPSGVTTEVTTGGVTTTITPTTDAPITSDSEGNIVIPEDVVITYTVTFNSNEGSSEIVTVEKGQTIALNNPFTSENTFAGWSTTADGAILYENGEIVTVTEHLTFYARWTTPTNYEVGDDDKAKLDAAVAGDFKEVFAEVEGSFYAEITLLGANGQPDHQTEITFTVPYPSGITATGYTFVVLHYNETSFQVEQIANSKVNPTASGLKITSTVSPFIIGYSAISNGNGGGNGGNGGGSSTPQGSSVWLTEPLTPTPTETAQPTPTDVAPTDVPTTQPTPTQTETPGFGVLAVLAGLGAVAALRRK